MSEINDLEAAILERLPVEGSKAGYHDLAATVAHLKKELKDALPHDQKQYAPTSDQISASLRSMAIRSRGLARSVRLSAAKLTGWQITPKGQQALAAHRGTQAPSPSLRQVV